MARTKYKQLKDGRYYYQLYTGRYNDNGTRQRIVVYGKSSAEVDRKVIDARLELEKGNYIRKDSSMILADYADAWYNLYKSKRTTNTQKMYLNAIKHIKESIGYIKVKDLRPSDIQVLINSTYEHPRQCRINLQTIRQINKLAVKDHLMTEYICDEVDLPRLKCVESKRALTDQEKKALKKADFSSTELMFVSIIYYFGLRKSEALGLMKSDFDFKNKIIHVHRALQVGKVRSETFIKDTKNTSSYRDVPMPDAVISILKTYLSQCDNLYVFTSKNGFLYTETMYRRMWERIVDKMNDAVITKSLKDKASRFSPAARRSLMPIQGLTAHMFRHNYATMLYYSGITLKKAAQLLGHANTDMIMKIYAHLDDKKEDAITKINKVIGL